MDSQLHLGWTGLDIIILAMQESVNITFLLRLLCRLFGVEAVDITTQYQGLRNLIPPVVIYAWTSSVTEYPCEAFVAGNMRTKVSRVNS